MKVRTSSGPAALAALSLLAPTSFAQLRSSPSLDRDSLTLTFMSNPITPFRSITDAPSSGTQTTEMVQTLANGTHLTRVPPTDTATWRDSAGRVRTEKAPLSNSVKFTPPVVVEISDPVAGFSIILDTQNLVAHRVPLKAVSVRPMPAAMPATLPQLPARTSPSGVVTENLPLGNRIINGLETMGMRVTMIYPPGSHMGNDQPVSNVSESWFSRRLGMILLSKNSNPDMSDFTTAWKDLLLTEPNPELFRVPAEYKIVDETGPFSVKFLRQP